MYKRLFIATILPAIVASWTVDHPRRPKVSASPLCHTDGEDLFLQLEEELELKSFASINTLCPVLVPTVGQRKLAFLAAPFKSEHMTFSDGIMYLRCLVARGIILAQQSLSIGVKETAKILIALGTLIKHLCNLRTLLECVQQPFPFADHVLPDGVGLSNAMVFFLFGLVVTVSFTLGLYQSTLAKLRKEDSIYMKEQAEKEKKEFEEKNKLFEAASTTSEETESLDALVNTIAAVKSESTSVEPTLKEEEKIEKQSMEEEPIENDSTVISGLTSDQSTLIASPPGTPARVTFDTQPHSPSTPSKKEKKNKNSLTPKSPRRKMRNPFKRKKNKVTAE